MNAAATIYVELPSSGAPHHLPMRDLGSAPPPAPSLPCRGEAGPRGEPGEGALPSFSILAEMTADIAGRDALLEREGDGIRERFEAGQLQLGEFHITRLAS